MQTYFNTVMLGEGAVVKIRVGFLKMYFLSSAVFPVTPVTNPGLASEHAFFVFIEHERVLSYCPSALTT